MAATDGSTATEGVAVAPTRARRLLGVTGAVLAAVTLYAAGGALGGVFGIGLVVGWYLLPPPWLVVLAHVAVLVLVGGDPRIGWLVPFELGLVGVVAGDGYGSGDVTRSTLLTGTAALLLAGIAWATLLATGSLWIAALTLLVLGGTLAYAVHRLELLWIGKLDPETDADDETTEAEDRTGSTAEVTGA